MWLLTISKADYARCSAEPQSGVDATGLGPLCVMAKPECVRMLPQQQLCAPVVPGCEDLSEAKVQGGIVISSSIPGP